MSRSLRPVALLAATLLLAVGAQAQRIEKSFPADAETVVDLRNQVGQVRLHGWSQPLVKVNVPLSPRTKLLPVVPVTVSAPKPPMM